MAYGSVENRMSSAGMPVGAVIAYAGDIDSIPAGWHICDGTEGTPDLRGRFVLGQSSAYAYGNEGGEATHTLTTNEMPRHNHTMYLVDGGSDRYNVINDIKTTHTKTASGNSSPIAYVGSSQPHNNMPPYYVLYYIMRIA